MPSGSVTRTPTYSGVPSPWTAFAAVGAASVHQALADSTDGSYVESSSTLTTAKTQLMYVGFPDLALPTDAVIEYVQPIIRERHGASGWMTVAKIRARTSTGSPSSQWSQGQTGTNPADNVFRTTNGPIITKASDGTRWSDCDPTTFVAEIVWGPNWYDTYFSSITTKPALAKLDLKIAYRTPPAVTISEPAGSTVTTSLPRVDWATGETQEAYRVAVVPTTASDGAGRTAGSAGFDPATASSVAYDSGKQYSANTETIVAYHLPPGTPYYFYVRSWAPSVEGTEMPSAWKRSTNTVTVSVPGVSSVTPPQVTIAEHTATYSAQVTVTRTTATGGQQTATWFSLQRYNDATASWEDVQGAQRLSGPGAWSYFDSTRSSGSTLRYRARGVFLTSANVQVSSPWVEATFVFPNRGEWWLKDPTDAFLNTLIWVAESPYDIPKPQEVAYGAGAVGATVTHQGVRAPVHHLKVWCRDAENWAAVKALIYSGRTLVLQNVYGEASRVQVGDPTNVTVIKATPLPDEFTPIRNIRTVSLTLIEVEAVSGVKITAVDKALAGAVVIVPHPDRRILGGTQPKRYQLRLDGTGSVLVSEVVWQRMLEIMAKDPAAPRFVVTGGTETPPDLIVAPIEQGRAIFEHTTGQFTVRTK